MKRRVQIDIKEIEKYYFITEDGMIYSHIRKRWLKPQINICGYVHYCLSFGVPRGTWVFAHTLVAYKYIGSPPTEWHEIDHLDENKQNNHYTNLCWRTHSENILESYRRGRRGYWFGRDKKPHSLETRLKMSDAKKKPVLYQFDGMEAVFESIDDASVQLDTYRKKIYNCIKFNRSLEGGRLSFIADTPPALC